MTIRVLILAFALLLLPSLATAHCDTLSGPVVTDAKHALATQDVTPVLKWLRQADEAEVQQLFQHTLKVRSLGPEAENLADRFFFETIVRLHRAGEGAPYTGLRSDAPEPVIRLTDEALSNGSAEALLQALNRHLGAELKSKFEATRLAKAQSASSVEAGRRYVAAYVDLTHFVERVHDAMLTSGAHDHNKH